MFKVIVGSIVGGLIATVWGFFSWGVFSWHDVAINTFDNQKHVAQVIQDHATVDGVYIIPSFRFNSKEMRQKKSCQSAGMPFVYAQVKKEGSTCSSYTHICSFLSQCVVACFLSILLLKTMMESKYGARLFFVAMIGLIIGVGGVLPNWIWFGSGYRFSLIMIIDVFIQWFLVGLFLAKFIHPKSIKNA